MRVRLVIEGVPVPLQRSRTRGGRHYLPARSKAYRALVQAEWMAAGRPSLDGMPFAASLRFVGARATADLDNLCKAVLDALNGLTYVDDSQLVCLSGHKLPVDAGGPRCELELWAVDRQVAA